MLTWVVIGISILLANVEGQKPDVLDCDFESDTCYWKSKRGLWIRSNKQEGNVGPASDHTTGDGYYLIMKTTYESGDMVATLRAPGINVVNGTCLTFWYYMYGYEVYILEVSKRERGKSWQTVFQVAGNQGMQWLKAAINIESGKFSFKFTATYKGGEGHGSIAIDDISFISEDNCQQQITRPVFDCDFEEDLCFWAFPYIYDWGSERVTFSTSNRTRTTFAPGNSGSSLLRLKRPHRYNPKLKLIAPAIPVGKNGACLSFWYKQYGSYEGIRRFTVRKTEIGSTPERTRDYEEIEADVVSEVMSGYRSSSFYERIWTLAQVNLPAGDDYFFFFDIEFSGYAESIPYIDIDDIKMTEGPCKPEPQDYLVNCDFEKDLCNWYSISEHESNWVRRRGPTPEDFTGPPGDHTTGDGYYIHFQDPKRYSSQIRTPPFKVSPNGACLTFWYYMYGEDIERFSLLGEYTDGGHNILFNKEGNQGEQWTQENISIYDEGVMVLSFSATKGYFPRADIAVDDISITFDGVCEKDKISTTTVSTTEASTTVTEERKWLPSPVITIVGDTKPALVNSRVEIICGEQLDGASYIWLKKGEHEFDVIEGQVNRTLLYDKIGMFQEGSYMCSVSREGYLNAESETFDIQVVMPQLPNPTATVIGMENPVYENSRIELVCQTSNNDTEVSYVWTSVQGTKLTNIPETSHVLVFDEIQVGQTANYSCIIRKDGFHSAESQFVDIRVVSDPRPVPWLRLNAPESPIEANKRITFQCGDKDVKRGVFHWKTDSAAFATSTLPNSRTLTIEKSNASHSGSYSCRISKDGYFTAKSRTLQIAVAPGKPCTSRYSCWGDHHSGKCVNKRCECASKAVFHGDRCVERPRSPTIKVSPDFRKFAFGETFYVLCNVREPVPSSLVYSFRKDSKVIGREEEPETYYIHKVANASWVDSGYYKCAIKSDGISSYHSDSLYIRVTEFADYNCDFESQTTCAWFQVDNPNAVNFTVEEEHSTSKKSTETVSNFYLRLPLRLDKQISRGYLRTSKLDQTNLDSCLSFRYRMHGPGVYSLGVWRYTSLWQDSPDRNNLWTAIGDKGDRWIKKRLTIESHGEIYLQFEAVGEVAIDDVQYTYRGRC